MALPAHADLLAVLDAGRDRDDDLALLQAARRRRGSRGTGATISLPRPRHSGHVPARTIWPSTVRTTCRTWPAPSQVVQVAG